MDRPRYALHLLHFPSKLIENWRFVNLHWKWPNWNSMESTHLILLIRQAVAWPNCLSTYSLTHVHDVTWSWPRLFIKILEAEELKKLWFHQTIFTHKSAYLWHGYWFRQLLQAINATSKFSGSFVVIVVIAEHGGYGCPNFFYIWNF